ncbi:MAG TPA: 1-deoxy-D-xylulose-5-phosphate reductoisomerase [Bryobacteraceae bacterium]|nr:1-deoxy-D-xylulose-5-phosphate reductoisomerase [Bryobacteraceae bacterium]
MKTLTILGSTGSIGTNTLDVVRRGAGEYRVHALAAGQNAKLLASQISEFRPKAAVVADPSTADQLAAALTDSGLPRPDWPEILSGPGGLVQVATAPEADTVISAIVGVAGLEATYEAAVLGKRIGLANKEALVSGGKLVMEAVKAHNALLVPIDSEHNGAHQCLRAGGRDQVSKLILTASGGPFRNTPAAQLATVTPEQALDHPTWKMGKRITIDCATLMNKGFEVIEACWLFGFSPAQVSVVVHPQSTVHAMVEYGDGSVIAQVCATDMRMPIQYALTYPDRRDAPVPRIDWTQARQWDFLPPDFGKFPLLRLAYQCQEAGGSATCILNAADEIAVESFLAGRIGYLSIYDIVRETLERMPDRTPATVADVLEIDRAARRQALALVESRAAAAV